MTAPTVGPVHVASSEPPALGKLMPTGTHMPAPPPINTRGCECTTLVTPRSLATRSRSIATDVGVNPKWTLENRPQRLIARLRRHMSGVKERKKTPAEGSQPLEAILVQQLRCPRWQKLRWTHELKKMLMPQARALRARQRKAQAECHRRTSLCLHFGAWVSAGKHRSDGSERAANRTGA